MIKERDIKRLDQLGTLLNESKVFSCLCKVAAETLRDDSLILSYNQIDFLKEKSAGFYLMEETFLFMFLNFNFKFKDKYQRTTMASIYIRDLNYEQQKEFFKKVHLNSKFIDKISLRS